MTFSVKAFLTLLQGSDAVALCHVYNLKLPVYKIVLPLKIISSSKTC